MNFIGAIAFVLRIAGSRRQFATRAQKIVRARTETMGDLNREAAETLG